ncbi:hypothetical protein DH2020_011420 [Rehmannia glutinosa]|uniref:Uncharacterized protein n=1 Tax=Rehmannia glutinosa TaxID=99300 RepID=A0ABR0XDA3_REHGL
MGSICAEQQHKFHHAHQLYLAKNPSAKSTSHRGSSSAAERRRHPPPPLTCTWTPQGGGRRVLEIPPLQQRRRLRRLRPDTRPTISDVRSSRSGNAIGAGATTGPTARSLTRAKKPGGGIRGGTYIPEPSAPISGKAIAARAITASSRTGFSSVGYTPRATAPRRARMGRIASVRCVFSLTRHDSCVSCQRAHLLLRGWRWNLHPRRRRSTHTIIVSTAAVSSATP